MAPDLGEWAIVPFLRVIPGDSWVVYMPSTVPASLAREPENPGRVEELYRPPLPNYREQAQARSWHGRHWPGLQVVNTGETRLANMAFCRFLKALR